MDAAEEFNVVEDVNVLRKLSSKIPKDVSLEECLTGLTISTQLDRLGFKPIALENFLGAMLGAAADQDISDTEMGSLIQRFHMTSINSGLEYRELADEYDRLLEEKRETRVQINELVTELETLREEHSNKMADAKITDKKLDKYINDKTVLENEDLLIDDLENTVKVIKELKKRGYDAGIIIQLIKKYDSLVKQIETLENIKEKIGNENTRLETRKKQLDKDNKILDDEILLLEKDVKMLEGRKAELYKDARILLQDFNILLKSITTRFEKDINDPKNGLKAKVLDMVEDTIEKAETKIDKFEEDSNQKLDQVIDKTQATQDRVMAIEERIQRYSITLRNFRSLENLSQLFLGEEIPRGQKLHTIVSTIEILEHALNYEGLKHEAQELGRVKENVFRSS